MNDYTRQAFMQKIKEEAEAKRRAAASNVIESAQPSSKPFIDEAEERAKFMEMFGLSEPKSLENEAFATQADASEEFDVDTSVEFDDFDTEEIVDEAGDYDDSDNYASVELEASEQPVEGSTENDSVMQELAEVRRQNAELMKTILQQQQQLLNTQQFMQQAQQRHEAARQEVMNTAQGFEHLTFEDCTSEFCGQPFKYQRYDDTVQFSRRFELGLSEEDSAKNFVALSDEICADIEHKFGGWDRITDFAVVSNLLIINSVSYEPILPQGYADSLPFDLRNNVNAGQFAWLFDFGLLRKMTRLTNLKFDSADFVYCKVRKDLHIVHGFSCKSFFKTCKNLMNLQIGQTVITSSSPADDGELFKRASRAEELYQKCCDNTWGFTKNRWGSVRDVFMDSDRSGLGKVWGVTWRGAVALGGTAATIGVKGAGLLGKIGKGIGNIASAIKDNM